jgi:predicted Ser/Thr protein kinase
VWIVLRYRVLSNLRSHACLDKTSIHDIKVLQFLLYPHSGAEYCKSRSLKLTRDLEEMGIKYVCYPVQGNVVFGGLYNFKVLGKGHSSVVLLGLGEQGEVAVKIRRCDSKKQTLVEEARVQIKAALAGVAPRVYDFNHDIIVMEFIEGIPLRKLSTGNLTRICGLVHIILEPAYILDTLGILHRELSRPIEHIIVSQHGKHTVARIIDFDSAVEGKCGNVPKVVSWLLSRTSRLLSEMDYSDLMKLLRRYKRVCERALFKRIADLLENVVCRAE